MNKKMVNKITDINDLVLSLAVLAMKPLLSDEVWQCYGYKKRPKHGNIWNRISPKIFELENFIQKELIVMGLIDVFNGVKKSTENSDTKLLISIGIVDQFLSLPNNKSHELFMENLFSTYDTYLKSEKSKIHEPIILKAKDVLGKKDFAKFMVGTIRLVAIHNTGDFLLKSDYIKDVIEKSSTEGKLDIYIPNEVYRQYLPLIEEKILNT